jgi:hypothetical protein
MPLAAIARVGIGILSLAALAAPVGGQSMQPAVSHGTLAPPLPLDPVQYTASGEVAPGSTTQPAPLWRDGAMLARRVGKFVKDPQTGSWQFIPREDPSLPAVTAPMTVLPSARLAAVETAAGGKPQSDDFTVTGQVTRYDDQNYLLLQLATPGDAVLAAERTAPTSRPADAPPLPASEMLNQMLAQSNSARPLMPATAPSIDKTSGDGAVAPGAAPMTVLREGSYLVDRTGRLSRGADGQTWEFNFDADGRTMKDPPVIVLPNLKLMSMEQAAKSSSHEPRFRISGMVTEYAGRNYILLDKVVVVPEATQQF